MSLARETLPQATAVEARRSLTLAASALGLELIDNISVIPSFLLVPGAAAQGGAVPAVLLFATWHAESAPVVPAAVEGAERMALAVTLAGLAEARARWTGPEPAPSVAVVVHPSAGQGSRALSELLNQHRERIQAPAAFWTRIQPDSPRRRRVYLGARGRVVLGLWGGDANPYRVRDALIEQLREEAYGPRPLDFELLRKLGQSREALDFLEETLDDPGAVAGEGEERLKRALFEPRGQVVTSAVAHPDRPRAWLIMEGAESMDPSELLRRAREMAKGSTVEMAEGYLWDRLNIHHPSIQAEIGLSKSVSEGAEIWPMAPWVTPSGIFTRSLGTPLAEWGIPNPAGSSVRFPKPEAFETVAREVAELITRCARGLIEPRGAGPGHRSSPAL